MLTGYFSRNTVRKLPKFCQGKLLVIIFVKTEQEEQKNEPLFLIGVAMGL